MKKAADILFSTRAAGIYILVFAAAIGVATFIENDYGTSSAQKMVFRARWFEALMLLFSISILVNIKRFRMIQQRKWSLLMFHLAILVILLGSAITRYTGYEGLMHIREGSASNEFLSAETYVQVRANYRGNEYEISNPAEFATLGRNRLKESYQIEDKVIELEVIDFIPNPERKLVDDPSGKAHMKLVVAGNNGREDHFLAYGDFRNIGGKFFYFGPNPQPGTINFDYRNDSLVFSTPAPMTRMQMATQRRDPVEPGITQVLLPRSLYSNEEVNFVLSDFKPGARVEMASSDPKMRNESVAAVAVKVACDGEEKVSYTYGNKGRQGSPARMQFGDLMVTVSYGAIMKSLPFSIALRDFIMERYPGTNSASSYASEVTLIDPRDNLEMDYRIYMNNILNYNGYRFFQSSYDQDELGTILSVNHDFWGTVVSYIGYFLLTLGLVLTLFDKKSRFRFLSKQVKQLRKRNTAPAAVSIAGLCLLSFAAIAGSNVPEGMGKQISEDHASLYGRVLVQDHKGRIKPMNTLASEVLRKISRKEELFGLDANQVLLSMTVFPSDWTSVPMIKIGRHEELHRIIGVEGKLAPFDKFFTARGEYLLHEYVRNAHARDPIDRTKFDKEIIKVDERVNIVNMIFSRRIMRLYPIPDDINNTWIAPGDIAHNHNHSAGPNEFVEKFYPAYALMVEEAVESGDWSVCDDLLAELRKYQEQYGSAVVISERKSSLEIALNKSRVFASLGKLYGLLGLLFLIAFFASVMRPEWQRSWIPPVAFGMVALAFAAHTIGLGTRWYVSGHAPWSNGYESMIYIAWTSILAGLVFARKSIGGLAATSILSSIILMVAGLSWMDPEITPLVPVLRSYWLTIHVSLEAGSYGFLMLGAIIGTLNLLSMIFLKANNSGRIMRVVREMSYISEMTLMGGLIMVSVGTYLGGIWANESWGRYWGWDAKETWALVTILVYAFILHMRLIPGMRGLYAFNVASLFGFFSVMMTYFGVNYYLSGLHSYATGDPAPIPTFVYYTVASLVVISLLAYWKYRQFGVKNVDS